MRYVNYASLTYIHTYRQTRKPSLWWKNLGSGYGRTTKNLGFSVGFGYRNNTNKVIEVQ